jgi:hypothetical protein
MTGPDPSIELMLLINGYQVSQALHVAAMLGVADRLGWTEVLRDRGAGTWGALDLALSINACSRSGRRILKPS